MNYYYYYYYYYYGTRCSVVVEALCYKLKVAGWRSDEVDFSNLHSFSGRTMALGSTQPLAEMSTRNLKKETWG
jgi:hypothetical protein